MLEQKRAYYQAHKDEIIQKLKNYRARNRERLAKIRREWSKKYAAKKKENDRRYARTHKEQKRINNIRYRLANSARHKERCKQWNRENIAYRANYNKAYYEANKERILKNSRRYRASNKQRIYQRNRTRRGRQAGATGSHTAADIKAIWERQKHRCAIPDCVHPISTRGRNKYHVDHVKALISGGSDDKSNLQILCRYHNVSKHKKDEYKWAQEHGMLFPK